MQAKIKITERGDASLFTVGTSVGGRLLAMLATNFSFVPCQVACRGKGAATFTALLATIAPGLSLGLVDWTGPGMTSVASSASLAIDHVVVVLSQAVLTSGS